MPYRPLDQTVVLWDELQRPYWRYEDGGRSYIPPITAGQYHDDPKMLAWARSQGVDIAAGQMGERRGADFFHHRDRWNDEKGVYERPFDMGSLVTLGVGGMLGAGAISAFGAGGGAGAGAAGAGLGPLSGGVLPLGTGLTAGQMVTPSFAALTGAGAPIAGITAGTLPGGAVAPVVSPTTAGVAPVVGAETAAAMGAGGVLPLGTGLTAEQMTTPSFAALTGAGAPIAGITAGTLPGGATAPVVSPTMAGHGGYTPVVSPAPAATGGSFIERLQRMATTPEGMRSLMSLYPLLSSLTRGTGGGGSDLATSGIEDQIRRSMELSNRRMEQSQPVYDTLVNMAYGSTPTRQRGPAPAGYTPSPGPQGAYTYQSPRFGGQR